MGGMITFGGRVTEQRVFKPVKNVQAAYTTSGTGMIQNYARVVEMIWWRMGM